MLDLVRLGICMVCMLLSVILSGRSVDSSNEFDYILPAQPISKFTAKSNIVALSGPCDGRLFYAIREGSKTVIHAQDIRNGEIYWVRELPSLRAIVRLECLTNRIYIVANTTFRGVLYVLDATSGRVVWAYEGDILKFSLYPPFVFFQEEMIRTEPVFSEDIVYLVLGASKMVALGTYDGRTAWEFKIGIGYTKVNLYLGGKVLFMKAAEKFLKAFDRKTGEQVPDPIPAAYREMLIGIDNDFVIAGQYLFAQKRHVSEGLDEIICYDFLKNRVLWEREKPVFFPMFSRGNTFYAVHMEKQSSLALKRDMLLTAFDVASGEEKWSTAIDVFDPNLVLSSRNKLFLKSRKGNLLILDVRSGKVVWDMHRENHRGKIEEAFFSLEPESDKAVVAINNRIYYFPFEKANEN